MGWGVVNLSAIDLNILVVLDAVLSEQNVTQQLPASDAANRRPATL